ncbi:MAG: procyclic acidic repetitive family protein [Oscillospiraceae bacterium]|nr:procyclic acidic repetitive family protein [Oscillospiraceae bacterium]
MPDQDFDLEQFKSIINELPDTPQADPGLSVERIMAEERYTAITAPKGKKKQPREQERISAPQHTLPEPVPEPRRARKREPEPESELKRIRKREPEPTPAPVEKHEHKRDIKPPPRHRPHPEPEPYDFALPDDFAETFAAARAATERAWYKHKDPEQQSREQEESAARSGPSLLERIKQFVKKAPAPLDTMPEQAFERVEPYVLSLRVRVIASFALALPLIYIALAPALGLPLHESLLYTRQPYRYLMVTGLLQLLVMFCGVDIVAKGFTDFIHLRPGIETLVTVSGVVSLLHLLTLVIDINAFGGFIGFVPYTTVNGVIFAFTLWGNYYQHNGYKRTYQTAMYASDISVIACEENICDGVTYTKRPGALGGFVTRTETPDAARRVTALLAPVLLAAALLFALSASVGQGRPGFFFWSWSALSLACAPISAAFVFALPYSRVAKRLYIMGGAIAGWTAAREMRGGEFAAVTDNDLFSSDMIAINGRKVLSVATPDKANTYAASMLRSAGSGLYDAFTRDNPVTSLRAVTNLEHHESGGLSGEIQGERVLLGALPFMLRMGIRLPSELNVKKAVYLVISLELAAVYIINYIASTSTDNGLKMLARQRVVPLLAIRDFNITPLLLKEKYGADPDLLEYPPIEERIKISDNARNAFEKPSAFVSKAGLLPMAECISGALRLRKITSLNRLFYLACLLSGFLIMLFLTYSGSSDSAAAILPGNVMLYYLLWWLPVWFASSMAHRY